MNNLRVNSGLPVYVLIVLIGLFGVVFLFNFLHIFTINSEEGKASATSSTVDTSVALTPILSAPALSTDSISLTATPEHDSTFLSGQTSVDVSTNNGTGYTLTLSTNADYNELNLDGDTSASYKIGPLASETTLTDFSSPSHSASLNKWGFTTDNNSATTDPTTGTIIADHYLPVPNNTSARTIKVTDSQANTSTTDVTFSTKVDRSLAAGVYSNEVIFTAVANTNPSVFMQDFTATECNQLAPWGYDETTGTVIRGDTRYLWDKRDNQSYAVRKLADGNCWMVENFNLSAESLIANGHSTTLDSTDTDLASGTTFTVPATSNTNWGGESYPVEPKIATSNIPGYTDYGMYYNWWAATARTTDITTADSVAPDSICPKGWNLPTGGSNNQWYRLFDAHKSAYGWTNINSTGNDMSKINTTNVLSGDTVGPNLQFSGYWSYSGIRPRVQASHGDWWSSRVTDETNSYYTRIYKTGDVSSGTRGNGKRFGFPIRCLLPAT